MPINREWKSANFKWNFTTQEDENNNSNRNHVKDLSGLSVWYAPIFHASIWNVFPKCLHWLAQRDERRRMYCVSLRNPFDSNVRIGCRNIHASTATMDVIDGRRRRSNEWPKNHRQRRESSKMPHIAQIWLSRCGLPGMDTQIFYVCPENAQCDDINNKTELKKWTLKINVAVDKISEQRKWHL